MERSESECRVAGRQIGVESAIAQFRGIPHTKQPVVPGRQNHRELIGRVSEFPTDVLIEPRRGIRWFLYLRITIGIEAARLGFEEAEPLGFSVRPEEELI